MLDLIKKLKPGIGSFFADEKKTKLERK